MLQTSGMPDPELTNSSADLDQPWAVVFDRNRNLWVSNFGNGTLTMFTFTQLRALSTTPAPSASVVISGITDPAGMAFDKAGDLWVATEDSDTLVEFTADQLAASGSPTPNTTISSADLNIPVGLAFDKSGALWVSSNGADEVLQFTADQLAAGGAQTPNVVLQSDASSSIDHPEPLAFDQGGNLWVGNTEDPTLELGTVVQFSKSQLASSGSPTPVVTLTSTPIGNADSLEIPTGLAFDPVGNLWVGNVESDNWGSLAKFTPSQLRAGGSPSPTVFIDSNSAGTNIKEAFLITFGPLITF